MRDTDEVVKSIRRKTELYERQNENKTNDTSLCTYAVEPPCTEPYARWCERSGPTQPLLLD